jgi:basic membrane protein A
MGSGPIGGNGGGGDSGNQGGKIMRKTFLLALTFSGLVLGGAQAAEVKPAVVFDMGGKFDKSFNEGVYTGVERFKQETGIAYREFEVTNETQREQALRRMAQRGANPVLGIGFAQGPAMEKVAKEFPDTRFAIIDMVVDLPNVQSIVFKEHEGSFLVGVLAVMASKTGKVGFVGGMDIPLIRRFACGYEQGAKYQNADAEVLQNMTGTTPAAWNDPSKGSELAKSQFDRGADVVYAAAGGTGTGVYQAAKDSGKLAIGVDSNQNHLHPGTMLTSMLKRVDVAAYNVYKSAMDDTWQSGIQDLGLAEDGVGWALDENNESLVSAEMRARADQVKADIVSGKIKVHDYMSDNSCNY